MKEDKKIDELANYIVNRLNFGQAISILIEKSKKTAKYMLENNCKKEDFNLYLDKGDKPIKETPETPKKESFWAKLKNKFIPQSKKSEKEKSGVKRTGFRTTR